MSTTPHTTGSIAAYLASRLGSHGGAELVGRADLPLTRLERIEQAGPGSMTFIRSESFALRWARSRATCALVSRGIEASGHDPKDRALIFVSDADLALNEVLDLFAPPPVRPTPGVHATAVVDPGAKLGAGVSIAAHCVVGAGARVGDGSSLGAGVFLGRDVTIGRGCTLHPRVCVLDRCVVGDGCVLHAGVVIGADGFGYRPAPDGRGVVKIPHIGNVEIGAGVEIGANSCIDRAKFGSTVIGEGSKIDNLVQIGHGCIIGRVCLIAAQAGLSGSVTVGDGVQIGGQTGAADNVTIAAGTRLAGQSGVIGDIEKGTYLGTPPVPVREYFQMHATLRRLARAKQRGQGDKSPPRRKGGAS